MSEHYKHVDPDAPINVGRIAIFPDYEVWPVAQAVNVILKEAGRKERMRVFLFEGFVIGSGIWTQDKAAEIAKTGLFINGFISAPNDELSHMQEPGWQEISYKVDKGVVNLLVDKGLLIPIEGETEKFRLEMPKEIYGEGPYFMEVETSETDRKDIVNFRMTFVDRIPPTGTNIL